MTSPASRAALVLIGPLPPGTGGATRTFEEFCRGFDGLGVRYRTVDTAPGSVPGGLQRVARFVVALRLARLVVTNAVRRTPVVWFVSSGMVRFVGWMIPLLTRRAPVCLVSFGGILGQTLCDGQGRPVLRLVRFVDAARAVFVESELTASEVRGTGVGRVVVIGPTRGSWGTTPRLDPTPRAGRPLRLVFAGRVCLEKGLGDLARLASSAGGGVHVDVIGHAEPGQEQAVAEVVGASEHLTYLGPRSPADVLERLRAADFSVLLSSYPGEGIPGVVTESLLVGTPAVVSDFRALPELVDDGVNGLVVPEAGGGWDIIRLVDRLAVLDDGDLAAMRAAAAADAERFSPERQAERLLERLGILEVVSC